MKFSTLKHISLECQMDELSHCSALWSLGLSQATKYTETLLRKAHLSYFPSGITNLRTALLAGFQPTECL